MSNGHQVTIYVSLSRGQPCRLEHIYTWPTELHRTYKVIVWYQDLRDALNQADWIRETYQIDFKKK